MRYARSAAAAALALAACHGEYDPVDPGLRVLGGPLAVAEAGGTATFTVALATAPQADVEVDVLAGDASEGLVATSPAAPRAWATLRFGTSGWDVPQTVTVSGVDDAIRDGDVSWAVTLAVSASDDPAYASAPGVSVAAVTLDDDTPGVRVSRTTVYTAETGEPSDGFEVSLASQPAGVVTVPVSSGDASEGLLSGGPHAIAPAPWIDLVFTPSSWSIPQPVTVTALDDDDVDGGQVYAITVGPASGDPEYALLPAQDVVAVNADTDVAEVVIYCGETSFNEGSSRGLSVLLSARPAEPVQVPIVSTDPSEVWLGVPGGATPGGALTLSFDASNWSVPQYVFVWTRADFAVLGPRTVALTVGPATGDPIFAAVPASTLELTLLDQDLPADVLASAGSVEVTEGRVSGFYLWLSTVPSEPVTIRVESSDASVAWLNSSWAETATTSALTFRFDANDWQYLRWVDVFGTADGIVDGAQAASVTIRAPSGDARYAALPPKVVAVTVADADVPRINVSHSGLTMVEGASRELLVSLGAAPAHAVTVPVASSDPAEALLSVDGSTPAPTVSLTFHPATWFADARSITVHAVDDAVLEPGPPHAFTVRVGPATSAGPYEGVTGFAYQGSVIDDEPLPGEGTPASPVELTGIVPWAGQVGTDSSWYRLSGFADGGIVSVVGALAGVSVSVLEDAPGNAVLCGPRDAGTPVTCPLRLPPGGAFLVHVDGSATLRGSSFTVDAAPFAFAPTSALAIPDDPYAALSTDVVLSGVPAGYTAVAIFVEIAHPRVGDLDVFVIPPTGGMYQVACSGAFEGADYDRTVLFGDPGLPWVCAASPPFAGTFRSAVSLPHPSDANGTWRLQVRDVVPGEAGTLVRWGVAAR